MQSCAKLTRKSLCVRPILPHVQPTVLGSWLWSARDICDVDPYLLQQIDIRLELTIRIWAGFPDRVYSHGMFQYNHHERRLATKAEPLSDHSHRRAPLWSCQDLGCAIASFLRPH